MSTESATPNVWSALAHGATPPGAPPLVVLKEPAREPSLTAQFNAAANPTGQTANQEAARLARIAHLKAQVTATIAEITRPQGTKAEVTGPIACRRQLAALQKKLSQPRHTYERTPLGSVTRAYHPQQDRKLMQQIKAIEARLDQHRGQAQTAFNNAARRGMS